MENSLDYIFMCCEREKARYVLASVHDLGWRWVGCGEKSEYNAIKIYKHSSLVSIFKACWIRGAGEQDTPARMKKMCSANLTPKPRPRNFRYWFIKHSCFKMRSLLSARSLTSFLRRQNPIRISVRYILIKNCWGLLTQPHVLAALTCHGNRNNGEKNWWKLKFASWNLWIFFCEYDEISFHRAPLDSFHPWFSPSRLPLAVVWQNDRFPLSMENHFIFMRSSACWR